MYFLGTIVTVLNASRNNTTTATPFVILPSVPRLLLVTAADSSGQGYFVTVLYGSSLAADADDFSLAGSTSTQIDCPKNYGVNTVLAVFIPASGTSTGSIDVYALFGPATS